MRDWLLLVSILAAGCTVDAIDLDGRACPCVSGWVCDEARDLCVPEGTMDGGAIDGGAIDAGSADAGPARDANTAADARVDASGALDGGALDAAGADTGADAFVALLDAGTDAHVDAGPCGGRYWCDGFESGDVSAWGGISKSDMAVVEVVSTMAHRGTYSLRAFGPIGTFQGVAWAEVLPVPQPRDLYFRAWYFVPSSNPDEFEIHEISNADGNSIVLYSVDATTSNMHTHGLPMDQWSNFTRPVPRDEWLCVEMHVRRGMTDGEINVSYNGTLVSSTPGINTILARELSEIAVGLVFREDIQPLANTIFVDDVVVDVAPIGCGAP